MQPRGLNSVLPVAGIPQGGFLASAKYGASDLLTDAFTPANDQEVEMHISFLTGSVTGVVADSRGGSAGGALVTLLPEESKRDRFDLYFTRTTDANGRFNFTDVPAGIYRAFAWEDIPDGAYQSVEFMRPFDGRGTPIRVEKGSADNLRLQLIP